MIKDKSSPDTARDVSRRTKRGRRAVVICSPKNNSTEVRLESGLEKDVALLIESDPRVRCYRAQPFVLELETNTIIDKKEDFKRRPGHVPRFYTPDFSCDMSNNKVYVLEPKHEKFQKDFERKKAEIEVCLNEHGMRFFKLSNKDMAPELVANMSCIHSFRAGYLLDYRTSNEKEIEPLLAMQQEWLITDLASRLSAGISAVITGLLNGQLTANLQESLFTPHAVVYAGGGDLSHFKILDFDQYE
jgi:hypothetical protein